MAELEKEITAEASEEIKETQVEEQVTEEQTQDAEKTLAAEEADDPKAAKKREKADRKKDKDKSKEKIAELEDKVKRQLAEFENYRNRTDKEKAAMFDMGAKSVIEKILPVVDNFERGLQAVPEAEKDSAFAEGMNKIYKQMMQELEGIGVKPIEAVGNEFNPDLHNAVMQVESEEFESGVVAQELQKGYMYRDGVVRHSMVAVVS